MTFLYAACLGAIQGLTEFLPVSSSAHLILARLFFGWDTEQFGVPFDVACHVGTLLAIMVFFRRDLVVMVRALPTAWQRTPAWPARQIRLIVVGTLPIVVLGLVGGASLGDLRTPAVVAAALAGGAIVLVIAEAVGARARTEHSMSWSEALLLGCAQAAALVPGVSRSGATISVGMLLGFEREGAARFSFLLGIPAIVAAAGHEALGLRQQAIDGTTLAVFGTGLLVSAVVGYGVIAGLLRYLVHHSLHVFAVYRLLLAASVVAWLMVQ